MVWPADVLDSLIELVMSQSCLYDHSNPKHYDKETVFNAWSLIGQTLSRRASQVRTMWRQLVKIYTWIHNNEQYKLDEECYWPHLEKMKFLKPFVGNNTVKMNMSCGEELIDYEASLEVGMPVAAFITFKSSQTEAADAEYLDGSFMQDDKECLQSQSPQSKDKNFSPHPSLHPPFPASLNGLAIQKKLEVDEVMCEYLRKKASKTKDPNELFLISVAHDMKMLSNHDQAVFKMKVQQLLVEMISQKNLEME